MTEDIAGVDLAGVGTTAEQRVSHLRGRDVEDISVFWTTAYIIFLH